MALSSRSKLLASMTNVMYTNAVYFPSERLYKGDTPGQMNYSCVNRVYYAYARVSLDGAVFLGDEWADTGMPVDGVKGGLGSLMHLRQKHPHLQVVLSIGGTEASPIFPVVAANTLSRDNFARSAAGLVEASGLDGIDVVWGVPNDAKQGHDFLSLLAAVRIHLPEDRFFLSVALPASTSVFQLIDMKAAAEYLDVINVMAYDFCGPWSSVTGHHAQLYSKDKEEDSGAKAVASLTSQGVPSKKILLGIPLYARSFFEATGPGQPFRGIGGVDGVFEYCQLPRRGCSETIDGHHVAAQCVGGDGGFVTYDVPETVQEKARFCKQKELAGLFYSHGPYDSRDKTRSLVAAGFRSLHTS